MSIVLMPIFQRFTRAHTDPADVQYVAGIALGLSIVENCVRAMGRRIDVRSAEGEGSAFIIALPVAPPPS